MSKRSFVGVMVVVLAVVVMAGGLLASNMGFKLNYVMNSSGASPLSKSGTTTIALPDNRQAGLNTAKQLMDDVGLANVTNVQKYLIATDTTQAYTGRRGNTSAQDFALASGEGYFAKMATTTNYIVVGSDNPTLASNLYAPGTVPVSKSGTNLFAYNYHQTAATAKGLMDDIGLASVTNVQKYLVATDTTQAYTGRRGNTSAQDFALTPGQAYFLKMTATMTYTPSHY